MIGECPIGKSLDRQKPDRLKSLGKCSIGKSLIGKNLGTADAADERDDRDDELQFYCRVDYCKQAHTHSKYLTLSLSYREAARFSLPGSKNLAASL